MPITPTAARPDYVPDQFWDATANTVKPEFTTHIGELAAAKAAQDARVAARPEKPDGYALEFPKDYKPEIQLEFKPDDPRVALLQAFAHEQNWSQAEFAKALTIEAAKEVATHKAIEAAQAAEMKKLGTNGTARVTAGKTFLTGILGADGAAQFMDRMVLASDIEAIEKLQQAFTTQGGSTFNGSGRETPPPPTIPLEKKLWPLRQAAS